LKGFAQNLNAALPPDQRSANLHQTDGKAEKSPAAVAFDGVAPPSGVTQAPATTPAARKAPQGAEKGTDKEL
jgi:hypothetical protein